MMLLVLYIVLNNEANKIKKAAALQYATASFKEN